MAIELYPHQTEAIKNLHNGGVLTGDVGTGKSITALAYWYIKVCRGMPKLKHTNVHQMANPMDLYVITTAKKRDGMEWDEDALHFNIGTSHIDPNGVKMTVDSWNNIDQWEHVTDAFFIFDEQRVVGSGAWVKSFLQIARNNQWIVLSATPGDVWMDYVPIFIAHGFYKNRTEFIRRHVEYEPFVKKFPKIKGYKETERLERLRAQVLVHMPYERHTIRKTTTINVQFDKELFDDIRKNRWHIHENRPIKDAAEMYQLLRKVVNSDLSRLGAIMLLLERHDRLIIYYNFNYELDILRTLGNTLGIKSAEWNGKKHDPVPTDDRWIYLVQYTAGAEGWNCITTDSMAFYSLTYSYKAFHQAKGRIDRLNTPFTELHYYVLRSAALTDQAIWKALMSKKNFNARAFIEKIWESQKTPMRTSY